MSTYIVQESEPWVALAEQRRARGVERSAQDEVRRPVRGLQIEKDTYAYFKVIDANGQELSFINSGAMTEDQDGVGKSMAYSNFLLQKVQISRAELKQFVKTFGLTYLFLFGENPIMLSVEGGLVHSADFRWDEEWWMNYERLLRATRLAEQGARAYLCYEGYLVEGYILDAVTSREANVKHLVPLAFEMVATNICYLAKVGSTDFPVRSTLFTAEQPSMFGGRDINSVLPIGRALQFGNANTANLLAGGTAAGGTLQFGSFRDMFTALSSNPSLLAGLTGDLAMSAMDAAMSRRIKMPPPYYGKIRENRDEYVAASGIQINQGSGLMDQDAVTRYQKQVETGEERQVAGDVARQVTSPATLSNGNPFETDSLNLSNTPGLGGSHGTGVLPDRDMDIPADGPHVSRSGNPFG